MKYYSLLLFIVLLGFSACKDNTSSKSSSAGDAIELKLNVKSGDQFTYEMTTTQKMTQSLMGKKIDLNQEMIFTFDYAVKSQSANETNLEATYKRIRMKQHSDMGDMEVDSDLPDKASPMYKELLNLKGKTFGITLNDKGEVTKVSGMDQLGGNSMSDSSLRSMLEMSFKLYPDHPVKPGDTWKNDFQSDLGGIMKMKLANTYELIQVKDGVAEIKTESVISSEKGNNDQVEMNLSGTQSGIMRIEVKSGMLKGSKLKQKLSGKMKASGMEIPMDMESDVIMTGSSR